MNRSLAPALHSVEHRQLKSVCTPSKISLSSLPFTFSIYKICSTSFPSRAVFDTITELAYSRGISYSLRDTIITLYISGQSNSSATTYLPVTHVAPITINDCGIVARGFDLGSFQLS